MPQAAATTSGDASVSLATSVEEAIPDSADGDSGSANLRNPAAAENHTAEDAGPEDIVTALAVSIDMDISVNRDGMGSFSDAGDIGPGLDDSATNGIVRTGDSIEYKVSVNAFNGTAINEMFTLEAPAGTQWVQLPQACLASGSGISGGTLTCALGDLTNETISVPVVLKVTNDLVNADTVAISGTAKADNISDSVSIDSSVTSVSARPAFDLRKKDSYITDVKVKDDENGTPGVVYTFPMVVQTGPVDPKHPEYPNNLGTERLTDTVTFTDDISKLVNGKKSPSAKLFTADGQPAAAPNVHKPNGEAPPIWNAPRGGIANGSDTSVANGGTITAFQPAPGENIEITLAGFDSSLNHVPSKNAGGGQIPANTQIIISNYLRIWIPKAELDAEAQAAPGRTIPVSNTYSGFAPVSASGQPNSAENLANNTVDLNYTATDGATLGGWKNYSGVIGSGFNPSGKNNRPNVTPGDKFVSEVGIQNNSNNDATSTVVIDTFDATYQRVRSSGNVANVIPGGTTKYASNGLTDAEELQNFSGQGVTWYEDPDDVPGGRAAINAVRWEFDLDAKDAHGLYINLYAKEDAPKDAYLRNFMSFASPDVTPPGGNPGDRVFDTGDSDKANGVQADYLTVTPAIARVNKQVIDIGGTITNPGDTTQFGQAGTPIRYLLTPTLTAATDSATRYPFTVEDTLPVGLSYAGNASAEPDEIVNNADGTTTLRWNYAGIEPNQTIDPIAFDGLVDPMSHSGRVLTNKVQVVSTADTSAANLRSKERAITTQASEGLAIVKTAPTAVVIAGDNVTWNVQYHNTSSEELTNIDIIDVFPYLGDGRGPASNFHGKLELNAISAPPGSKVLYTDEAPANISIDPNDASNQPGGSTTWSSSKPAGATAVRVVDVDGIDSGEMNQFEVSFTTVGSRQSDLWTNHAGARAEQLTLPVRSQDVPVTAVSGSIGDFVWYDKNHNGLQDSDEENAPGVIVKLNGHDDRDTKVNRSTTTDAHGKYRFDGLRPGKYTVSFIAPAGFGFTTQGVGNDPSINSVANTAGIADSIALEVTEKDGVIEAVESNLDQDAGLIEIGPVDPTDPVDPTEPTVPGEVTNPIDPADSLHGTGSATSVANGPGGLASTGSQAPWFLALLAFGILIAGGVAVRLART
ncbi:SdrD B-like domain-containing protein [Leucobacter luti]|uniref:SdrD B-like domain-containing protein n=1 Tax=Leucobacter luti TaxID=340320 RepID=UPI001414CCB7|nr:SdrD B-like domain-containing protein [Leucobacter luti]